MAKLWVNVVITVVVCGLLIFGGMSVLTTREDKAEPWGYVAESSENHSTTELYQYLPDSP